MKKKTVKVDKYYEVFARETREGPLCHVGRHPSANRQMAIAQASMMYSEKVWVEMWVVPTEDIVPVIPAGSPVGIV
jgi:1,2-phenylacetyl-CoA epoxidase PaaB subunit